MIATFNFICMYTSACISSYLIGKKKICPEFTVIHSLGRTWFLVRDENITASDTLIIYLLHEIQIQQLHEQWNNNDHELLHQQKAQ